MRSHFVCLLAIVVLLFAVQLSVPWGHISGKSWGDPTGTHVLAIHGTDVIAMHVVL